MTEHALSKVSTADLERELESRRQTDIVDKAAKFFLESDWPNDPVGTWMITTEGDCEGKTTRNITTVSGHFAEVALAYAGYAEYKLTLETPKKSHLLKTKPKMQVSVGPGISSGLWDYSNEIIAEILQKWVGDDYIVKPDRYYKSVKIIRRRDV